MKRATDAEVYRAIRSMIVSGTFRGGHRLVEADLATALSTGRTHVRSALVRLEFEGLVVKEPGKSAIVRRVPKSELLEIIEARVALEAVVARAAAARRTEEQAQRLTTVLRSLEEKAAAVDIEGVLATQATFHDTVLEASRRPALQRIIHNLTALTAQTRMRSMLLPGRIPASVKEHAAIASAIVAHDGDAAERAMAAHLRGVGQAIGSLPEPVFDGRTTPPNPTQENA